MPNAPSRVRIIVVQPPRESQTPDLSGSRAALDRLGGEFAVERVSDAATCLAHCRRSDVDLVIVENAEPDVGEPLMKALRDTGPPVVVVVDESSDDAALEWFQRGAADCVASGPALRDTLPVVALEQIRRWRVLRERTAAERQIDWLQRMHDTIVNGLPLALLVVNGDGCIVTVNPEFTRALGVPLEGAEGRPFAEALPADLVASAELGEVFAEAVAQGRGTTRIAHTEAAGRGPRAFEVRAERLDEEGCVLFVLSDVTERESLVKKIGDLQRYNENIIQNMNSALLVVDTEGRVTFANSAAETILGEPRGSLRDRRVWDWLHSRPNEPALLSRTLQDGARFKGAESAVTRRDGSVVPIGISCSPIVDADGSRLGAVAIFQDLTEIKQLQRQVLQTEKMASIGRLAAGVAHEINNPMGFIHANLFQMSEYLEDLRRVWGRVEALQKAVDGGGQREIRRASEQLAEVVREVDATFLLSDFSKAIRESQEGSERIRHIVQDLRNFSYQDTEQRELADVNECLDSTVSIVWTMMKHLVTLDKDYGELPPVRCFPMQLKQVFMNLIVNAYQAIEQRVRGSGSTGSIHLSTRREGDCVIVSVRDTGVGIAAEDLDRIFDPFFTTKEVGAGTGLGLSTSYNLVQRHGGTIRVRSNPGEGTTFEVILPLGNEAGPRG